MNDRAEHTDGNAARDRFKRDRVADEASQAAPHRSAFLDPEAHRPLPESFCAPPVSHLFQSWFLGGSERRAR